MYARRCGHPVRQLDGSSRGEVFRFLSILNSLRSVALTKLYAINPQPSVSTSTREFKGRSDSSELNVTTPRGMCGNGTRSGS